MEEDSDNLLNIIFPLGLPGHLQENADFSSYLTKLGTFRVDELNKEPDKLSDEEASVLEQTQELAFSNYKTFIQTAECSRAIFQQFKKTEGNLEDVLQRVPLFTQQCQDFSRSCCTIESKRRLCSLTLSRSTQILELLEIPQLMSMCVSGGHFEEALLLAAYVRRLERRHSSIPAILGIVRDTQTAWQAMLHQLLAQLRSDLPLPKCLLVVGLLRRMEVFSEAELRLKFLQARDSWFCAQLEAVAPGKEHLGRTVELSRQHLFAIATQYRAAFSDDPTRATNNEAAIFHGWLTQKVSQFVSTLEADLCQVEEGESLDSTLSQCMYFGLSLARVGADFRAIMAPVFSKVILHNFESAVRKATREFEGQVEKMNFDKVGVAASSASPSSASNSMHPPVSLLQFSALAVFCNALLGALNAVRLNAPLALAAPITGLLQGCLLAASRAIVARYRQEQLAFSPAERQGVQRLCTCFADDFLPHLHKCLQALFPAAGLAALLGLSPQHLAVAHLDKNLIVDPVRHLLPAQIEPTSLVPPQPDTRPESDTRPEPDTDDSELVPPTSDIPLAAKSEEVVTLEDEEARPEPDTRPAEPTEDSDIPSDAKSEEVATLEEEEEALVETEVVPVEDKGEELMATSGESFDMCAVSKEEKDEMSRDLL